MVGDTDGDTLFPSITRIGVKAAGTHQSIRRYPRAVHGPDAAVPKVGPSKVDSSRAVMIGMLHQLTAQEGTLKRWITSFLGTMSIEDPSLWRLSAYC